MLLPALAVGVVALCLGYVRPLPVLCAGMALLVVRARPARHAGRRRARRSACCSRSSGRCRFRPSMPTGPAVALTLFTLGTRALADRGARHGRRALVRAAHALLHPARRVAHVGAAHATAGRARPCAGTSSARSPRPRSAVLAWVSPSPAPTCSSTSTAGASRGSILDPNAFGPYLVPAAVICLEDIMRPRLLRWRPSLVLGSFLVLALAIVLSFSRAGSREPRTRLPRHRARVRAAQRPPQVARARTRHPRRLRRVRRPARSSRRARSACSSSGPRRRDTTPSASPPRHSRSTRARRACSATGRASVETELSLNTHSTYVWSLFENGILGFAALLLLVGSTIDCGLAQRPAATMPARAWAARPCSAAGSASRSTGWSWTPITTGCCGSRRRSCGSSPACRRRRAQRAG